MFRKVSLFVEALILIGLSTFENLPTAARFLIICFGFNLSTYLLTIWRGVALEPEKFRAVTIAKVGIVLFIVTVRALEYYVSPIERTDLAVSAICSIYGAGEFVYGLSNLKKIGVRIPPFVEKAIAKRMKAYLGGKGGEDEKI